MRVRLLALSALLAACEPPKPTGTTPRESAVPDDTGDPAGVDSGDTDSGDTDADSGDTDSGDTDSGDTDTDSGDTDSGDTDSGDTDSGDTDPPVDADGDGFVADDDCDDADATVNPGATEICLSGVDEDCDGAGDDCEGAVWSVEDDAIGFVSDDEGDMVGRAISSAGDATGDGIPDLLVGAPGSDRSAYDAGAVYLVAGPISDASAAKALTLSGVRKADAAGSALELGDVDRDGVADLLIGAELGMADTDGGRAYLLYGPLSSDGSLKEADLCVDMAEKDDALGEVGVGADWTGDGLPELLLSAPTGGSASGGLVAVLDATVASGTEGTCYGLSGSDGAASAAVVALFDGGVRGDEASHIGQQGDLDGDGVAELRIGAPSHKAGTGDDSGILYVITECAAGTCDLSSSSSYDLKIRGSGAYEYLGVSSATSDLDGDGYADLAVGAPGDAVVGAAPGGAVYLFAGGAGFSRTSGVTDAVGVLGDLTDGRAFGRSLCGGMDLDGDGAEDLLVTSSGEADAGEAYVFFGPRTGSGTTDDASGSFTHADAGAGLGHTRYGGACGDLTGDGLDDVVMGADHAGDLSSPGAVYLFPGAAY